MHQWISAVGDSLISLPCSVFSDRSNPLPHPQHYFRYLFHRAFLLLCTKYPKAESYSRKTFSFRKACWEQRIFFFLAFFINKSFGEINDASCNEWKWRQNIKICLLEKFLRIKWVSSYTISSTENGVNVSICKSDAVSCHTPDMKILISQILSAWKT